jgi:hypothetical protein
MSTAMGDKKVSDLTAGELKSLTRDTIYELIDPDYGLVLKSGVEEALKKSIESKERKNAEEVADELDLKW